MLPDDYARIGDADNGHETAGRERLPSWGNPRRAVIAGTVACVLLGAMTYLSIQTGGGDRERPVHEPSGGEQFPAGRHQTPVQRSGARPSEHGGDLAPQRWAADRLGQPAAESSGAAGSGTPADGGVGTGADDGGDRRHRSGDPGTAGP